jgi:hypothetical protein
MLSQLAARPADVVLCFLEYRSADARASDHWGCETVWLKAVRTTQGHMAAVAPVLKPWLPEAMAATTVRQ